MRFQAEEGTNTINVAGTEYTVDEQGGFHCPNPEHHHQLRILGCRGEDEPSPARVTAAEPPAVPEGLVDEEAVRALIEENESLKADLLKAQQECTGLVAANDLLRDRVQELETRVASAATEGSTETLSGSGEGESGTGTADNATTAPPASLVQEVDGVLVTDPEAFEVMEYNPLKEWLKVHGVHVPATIKKVDAIAACQTRFAQLTNPEA